MNKRIKELAEQAGFGSAWFMQSAPGYPALPKEGMLKEFAELVVKECLEQVRDECQYEYDWQLADAVTKRVMEHFGIEE